MHEYAWGKRNIVDIARLGKMHKLIRSEIMTTHDEPVFGTGASWPRTFRFIISLFSGGLLAPILVNFTKEIYMKRTFWNDMTGKTLHYQQINQVAQDHPVAQDTKERDLI